MAGFGQVLNNVMGGGGPLIKLETPATYNVRKFPDDIADTPYFIVFRSVSKSSLGGILGRFGANLPSGGGFGATLVRNTLNNITIPHKGIALPIPTTLQTSYNAQYNDASLGPLGAIGKRVGGNYSGPSDGSYYKGLANAVRGANISQADVTGAASSMVMGGVEDGGLAALVGGLLGGPGGAAAGGAAAALGRGALAGAGVARNPHLASVFTGVNFKRHNFQYKFVANNPNESNTLQAIIKDFKYAMAPRYQAGDHIFQYPNEFDITLAAGAYLFKIGRSVLEDFTVDYTGEGTPAFFEETGAPYSVTLNLSFKETTIVTKREVGQGR